MFRLMNPVFTLLVTACIGFSCYAVEPIDRTPESILPVPDAVASKQDEMKPYAEPIEHTEYKIEMVPIPGGSFLMGSPENEADRDLTILDW